MPPWSLLLTVAALATGCQRTVTFEYNTEDTGCDTTWYGDADEDGYGGTRFTVTACEAPPGYVSNRDDCDDLEPNQNPSLEEICGDSIDNDCSGEADEACITDLDDGTAFYGTSTGEGGFALAVGDFNGDGGEDIVIGTPAATVLTPNDGGAALFFWPHDSDRDLSTADVPILGEPDGRNVFGYTVSVPGDLDGDGLEDLLVTAPQARNSSDISTGAVALFYGESLVAAAEGAPLGIGSSDTLWFGAERQDYFGSSISYTDVGGDVSIFIGASGTGLDQGTVYLLYRGALSAEIYGEDESDRIGRLGRLAAGDFNGDGVADVFIGAHQRNNDDGEVYACLGPVTGTQSAADCDRIQGEDSGSLFGESVAPAGDIDGDGLEDLWIAAPSYDGEHIDEGVVYLIAGDTKNSDLDGQNIADLTTTRLVGTDTRDKLGSTISRGEDINQDGFSDALIGAIELGQLEQGVATLFYGPLSGTILSGAADQIYTSVTETDRAGEALAMLPEMGALLIDTPESDKGTTNGGTTWLISHD